MATRSPSSAVATPTESMTATKPPSTAVATCKADMTASTALIIPMGTHTTDMMQMMVDIMAYNNTGGKIDDANESVLYHHLFNGDSSHGPIDHASLSGTLFPSICPHDRIAPPWAHVFSKSTQLSSLCTQAASIAHIEQEVHKKACHHRNRRTKKKMLKQKKLLTEVILPESIKHTLLSASDIDKEIIVVDGGDDGNPPICRPEGLIWRLLSVREGIYIHVQDKPDPFRGLTCSCVNGVLPFAWLP
jgi:hypothetical protein